MSGEPFPYDHSAAAAVPAVPMPLPPPRVRHPLGLPAGSVRALMIIMVMGTIWTLLLMPKIEVPLYLYYLLFLTTGAYFASRGQAKGSPETPPLYLPRGSIRFLLVVGFFGVMGYAITKDPSGLSGFIDRPLLSVKDQKETLQLPLVMMGAFLLAVVVSAIARKLLAGPQGMPPWYQDVQGWVSVRAVLGLGAQVILELVVFPTMDKSPSLPHLEFILSAIVAFYFGARV